MEAKRDPVVVITRVVVEGIEVTVSGECAAHLLKYILVPVLVKVSKHNRMPFL